MKTPDDIYSSSERKMSHRAKSYDYPSHFEVRLVSNNCGIRWKHKRVNVSSTLIKEYIGFEEVDNGVYNVYFNHFIIGRFFEELNIIKDVIKRIPLINKNIIKCNPCT